MDLLAWLGIGIVAGALAGHLIRHSGNGVIGDIIIGMLGAILGGFSATVAFGIPNAVNGFNILSVVIAFIGAMVLFVLIRAAPSKKAA